MSQKAPGSHLAVGYWGHNPRCRIEGSQIAEQEKVLLQDALLGMGRPMELYLPVGSDYSGAVACTCDKATRPAADHKCLSCHGNRFIPGYYRFMSETIFASSAEYASFTLTSTERDISIKPNRLRLTSSALTGTVETDDRAFANSSDTDWEYDVAAFRKTSTDTVTVEFSTDAGGTWTDITLINGANKPTGSGSIRFRVTLTRVALTTDSPDFEILRIRRRKDEDANPICYDVRTDLLTGQILMLRTWEVEQTLRTISQARKTDLQGDRAWTAPLDFFDATITVDTPAAKIDDHSTGSHPFYEHAFGIDIGERFPLVLARWDEQMWTFTYQSFDDRRSQTDGPYHLVF
jgi:hypothetical protein